MSAGGGPLRQTRGQDATRRTGAVTAIDDPPQLIDEEIVFADRRDAGRRLAALLQGRRGEQPVVIGVARGGVPVAAEIARALGAPLDVAVVRKVGAPANPEFAIGALAEGGVHVLSGRVVRALGLSEATLAALIAGAERELGERLARYRGARPPVELAGRTAILVDDGLATGRTALAAVRSLRRRGAARVVLAAPVASRDAAAALSEEIDELVCVEVPADLWAVGYWYRDFSPTTDEEVAALLAEASGSGASGQAGAEAATTREEVSIPIAPGVSLPGELTLPRGARGLIAFAHGSGSSRMSPRNRTVAAALADAGFATLLFDLLTHGEESDRANVFDVPLLVNRLVAASSWLARRTDVGALPFGYFGASTGAAAALGAAATLGDRVGAVVSRGGRPDLAPDLAAVRAPTLLIVGGADQPVLEYNRRAQALMRCPVELAVVPGAGHLFEEPGALEQVSRLAIEWFSAQLAEGAR